MNVSESIQKIVHLCPENTPTNAPHHISLQHQHGQKRNTKQASLSLVRESNPRRPLRLVENDKHALEEDIPQNIEPDPRVGLDAAETQPAADGRVSDVGAGHDERPAADDEGEVRQGGGAGVDVAALGVVVARAGDSVVVGRDNVLGQVEEGGARVGDAVAQVAAGRRVAANAVPARGEFPEAVARRHGDVGDGARVLGRVDVAEVVATWGTLLQVGGEEWLGERALDSVYDWSVRSQYIRSHQWGHTEKGRLRLWLDGVDAAECKTKETVIVGVLSELAGDGSGSLNSLRGGSHTADNDLVGVDGTGGARVVAVGDGPAVALLESTGLAWVVLRVAGRFAARGKGREHPAMP